MSSSSAKRGRKPAAKPRKKQATTLPPIATDCPEDYSAVQKKFQEANGDHDPLSDELAVFDAYTGDDAQRRVMCALRIFAGYAGFDGDHHKQWCIDQVVMALLGSKESHNKWRLWFRGDMDEDGEYEFEPWDRGCPP